MSSSRFIFIFCILALVAGFFLYFMNPTPEEYGEPGGDGNEPVACTQEAMQCPDGTYVGRTGPNCEFALCPIPEGAIMEDGTLN